jgi:hypothetical protein
MDWAVLLAGVQADVEGVITDVLPIALGVFVVLAGITIAFGVLRKAGVRK